MSREQQTFVVADRIIGEGHSPFIVAEVGQAHDGSLGMAHAFIDAIADAGADAVKFQTHIAAAESTIHEPWRIKFSVQDETRYDYWRRMEFRPDQWEGLKKHADQRGIVFLSSPFSSEAVDLLLALNIPAWKIASGEVSNQPLLDKLLRTRLPLLISSGMSPLAELDNVVTQCSEARIPFAIFQCTSMYPCPPEKVGLNLLSVFRERYQCPVGLSDHSGKIFAGLAAVAAGANCIEIHVTFSRQMFGPDTAASLTFSELELLVTGARDIFQMLQSHVDKDLMAEDMYHLRQLFTKSVMLKEDLPAGTILDHEQLIAKKPGTGINASLMHKLVGKKLKRSVRAETPLQDDDIEWGIV